MLKNVTFPNYKPTSNEIKNISKALREDKITSIIFAIIWNIIVVFTIDALVKSFNFDLSREHQLSLLEEESFDEEEVKSIIEDIIKDFDIEKTVIKRYKTILFEEYNSELIAVRCCVLDSSLQVVEEEDWSAYITHSESVVVDTVVVSNEPHTPNIKLKDKARKKAEQRELVVLKENTQGQNVQNN